MKRTLITGGAGSGKTTIIAALKNRGCIAIDLDDCGICKWVDRKTAEEAKYQEGAGREWIESHRYEVEVPKLIELLAGLGSDADVFVGVKPTSTQMDEIANVFDEIYLLVPSKPVLRERLATRTSNFAKSPDERETIIVGTWIFEETCMRFGAIRLDADRPVDELVQRIMAG